MDEDAVESVSKFTADPTFSSVTDKAGDSALRNDRGNSDGLRSMPAFAMIRASTPDAARFFAILRVADLQSASEEKSPCRAIWASSRSNKSISGCSDLRTIAAYSVCRIVAPGGDFGGRCRGQPRSSLSRGWKPKMQKAKGRTLTILTPFASLGCDEF